VLSSPRRASEKDHFRYRPFLLLLSLPGFPLNAKCVVSGGKKKKRKKSVQRSSAKSARQKCKAVTSISGIVTIAQCTCRQKWKEKRNRDREREREREREKEWRSRFDHFCDYEPFSVYFSLPQADAFAN